MLEYRQRVDDLYYRGPDGRTEMELAVRARHVTVANDQKMSKLALEDVRGEFETFWYTRGSLQGRDEILSYFCPQVFGLYYIKLALAVVLSGGVERVDESGTKVRGEPHMVSCLVKKGLCLSLSSYSCSCW